MICGQQVRQATWTRTAAFCAERKGEGLYVCEAHQAELLAEGEDMTFAPGNAYGERHVALRLLWEGDDADTPIEASAEELALYAPIFHVAGGE